MDAVAIIAAADIPTAKRLSNSVFSGSSIPC
jgi:hypothetical protein